MGARDPLHPDGASQASLVFGPFTLDRGRSELRRDGVPVALTPKAYDALSLLAAHPGRLVSKETLLSTLWPNTFVEEGSLTSTIWMVRKALSDCGHWIETVPKRGYVFAAPVVVAAEPPPAAAEAQPPRPPLPDSTPVVARDRRGLALWLVAAAALLALVPWWWRPGAPSVTPASQAPNLQLIPVTSLPGAELDPALSPDGTRVAFSWGDEMGRAVYVTGVAGATPTRLTRGTGLDEQPAWSPDGTQLAFLRRLDADRMAVLVIPSPGGPERLVAEYRFPQALAKSSPPAWAPDGTSLVLSVFAHDRYTLQVVSLPSGEMRELDLGGPEAMGDFGPVLSGDATWLAFTRYTMGASSGTLMRQSLSGRLQPTGAAVSVDGAGRAPRASGWSPDGQVLSYVDGTRLMEWRAGAGVSQIYVSTSLLTGASTRWYGRDGQLAAKTVLSQSSSNFDVWSLRLGSPLATAAGGPEPIVQSTAPDEQARLSPDGTRLAFVSGRSGANELWVSAADGSNPRRLTHLDASVMGFPSWSPDGARLAFHARVPREPRLYVLPVTGDAPTALADGCCPSWSSDGQYLFATTVQGPPRIRRVHASDGAVEEWFTGDLPVEVPGRRRLLYAKSLAPGLFWRSLDGDPMRNPEERLVDDYVPPTGGFVPVDNGVVYTAFSGPGRPRAFRFFDFDRRTSRDLAPTPDRLGNVISLSPDHRLVVYTAPAPDAGADLYLLDVAAAPRK